MPDGGLNGGLIDWLHKLGVNGELQTNLVASAIALVMLWGLHSVVQRFLVARLVKSPTARFNVHRAVRYLAVFSGVFIVGRIWFTGFQSVATLFGLLGAGVAIALKDPLTNLAGWVFLVVRHPFRIGDRIMIGPHIGDVVDVGLFQFELHEIGAWIDADQSTGRVIYVPNAQVFTQPQINYHRGLPYIFDDLMVNITFESNWRKAKEILLDIGRRHALHDAKRLPNDEPSMGETGFFMLGGAKDAQVFTSVRHSGVRLMLRYAVDPRRRTPTHSAIWEDVLEAFSLHDDIRWAYRTYRRVELPGPPALEPPEARERVPEPRGTAHASKKAGHGDDDG